MLVMALIVFFVGVAAAIAGLTGSYAESIRGWFGVGVAATLLIALQSYLAHASSKRRGNAKVAFFDLIITGDDNRFSLSRFQIYVWTVWVVIAFAQAAFASLSLPSIGPGLAALLGINGATAAISTAITKPPKTTTPPARKPSFFGDVFTGVDGTLDLPRTQMFIWTLVVLLAHVLAFWKSANTGEHTIPDVGPGLLILMGVSNGAYLGVKAADERRSAATTDQP